MEDDQQFCLRWNNHQSTLVAVFDTLLENGTLVDCTLAAEGKYLNAHKVVLSACSPYFEALLSQNYDKHPIFILKDVKFQELKAMMDYMYRGEVNISQDQLGALLKAAESLQIKGLSDNKKETETRKSTVPTPAKSPPPMTTTTLPRVQGLTIEQRRANRSVDEREGSLSPGPRKRKRMRRRSTDELDNHHDASNSSESHSNPMPIQNIPIALPPPSSSKIITADVPEPVETKSEILTRHKILPATNEPEIPQVPIIKEKLETHSELMLEPKAEYVEEMNEDSIEDLTLDDDDVSNLDMSNDGAGPSHGNAGEGSSQGFGGWHMGNQNQDEVFLAAQEAVGAHRDSQGAVRKDQFGNSIYTQVELNTTKVGEPSKCDTSICNERNFEIYQHESTSVNETPGDLIMKYEIFENFTEDPCFHTDTNNYDHIDENIAKLETKQAFIYEVPPVNDEIQKRTRNLVGDPQKWVRNMRKLKRARGQEYVNSIGRIISRKQIQSPCQNCRFKCSDKLNKEARELLFQEFWQLTDIETKRDYLCRHVRIYECLRPRTDNSRRKFSQIYSFIYQNETHKVCKKFFLSTLSISDKMVRIALEKTKQIKETPLISN